MGHAIASWPRVIATPNSAIPMADRCLMRLEVAQSSWPEATTVVMPCLLRNKHRGKHKCLLTGPYATGTLEFVGEVVD